MIITSFAVRNILLFFSASQYNWELESWPPTIADPAGHRRAT
jgi:hypothetical protein